MVPVYPWWTPEYHCDKATIPQGDQEEADTLIAFYVANSTDNIIVWWSDNDVLAIVIGALGQQRPDQISIHD